jgi:hypothetical protein
MEKSSRDEPKVTPRPPEILVASTYWQRVKPHYIANNVKETTQNLRVHIRGKEFTLAIARNT